MAKEWHGVIDEPDFSEEEDRIYNEAVETIRSALAEGLGFDAACGRVTVGSADLRRTIFDDYLKITLAEEHFNKQRSVEDVAADLRVDPARLLRARAEMIEEVRESSLEAWRREQAAAGGWGEEDGSGPGAGNA